MSQKTAIAKQGKSGRQLATAEASPPPQELVPHLALHDPDSLAIEALSLYEQVKAGEMDSSEAGRRANLLQVANNLRASPVHHEIRELAKRMVEAGALPASVLQSLRSKK